MQRFALSPAEAADGAILRGLQRTRDAGPALLVVDGDDFAVPVDADALAGLDCVAVAVHRGDGAAELEAFDLRLRVGSGDDPAYNFAGGAGEVEAWVERVAARLEDVGLPGVLAARLIGATHRQSVPEALFAESLTYSALQAGPEHARWLAGRDEARA